MVFHEYITRDDKVTTTLWYVLVSFLIEEWVLVVVSESFCNMLHTGHGYAWP
jgi:hypothetical protein